MIVRLRRITPVLVLLLALGACSDGKTDSSTPATNPVTPTTTSASFCATAQKAIGDAEAAMKALSAGQTAPAEIRQQQQQVTTGTNLMIQALQSPPAAIAGDAPVAIAQLQQIIAATNSNSVVPPLSPTQVTANQNVNNYLRSSCGIRSTNLFGSN